MEREEIINLRAIAEAQVKCAEEYAIARKKAGEAEVNLNILLAANLKSIREEKPNVGIDLAHIMLCEIHPEAAKFYQEWKRQEAIYKGLEKLLEARSAKLIFEQSLMKNEREGVRWG